MVAYYIDTRGLPDQSMLYAGPLLYVTTILAVITILEHGIKLGRSQEPVADGVGEIDESEPDADDDQATGADLEDEQEDSDPDPFFNRKNTTLYVGVTILYIVGLTVFSSFLTTVTFVALTAAFLGTVLFLYGERSVIRLVAYSVVFSALIWGVFISWLEVPLA